jgi:aldehyde dehydrogenase (NAD+)
VGRSIASKAAYNLKKFVMELGGKNPLILLKDFDVRRAVEIAGYGAFFHQGQVCMATSRIIVESPLYDEFCRLMVERARGMKVGAPHDKDTVVGPLIELAQCEAIDKQIEDAVAKGAKVLTGGSTRARSMSPRSWWT